MSNESRLLVVVFPVEAFVIVPLLAGGNTGKRSPPAIYTLLLFCNRSTINMNATSTGAAAL